MLLETPLGSVPATGRMVERQIYYYGRDAGDALPSNERADLGCLIVR